MIFFLFFHINLSNLQLTVSLSFSVRVWIHWLVTKPAFDMFIMFVIMLSSVALAAEDPVEEHSERNAMLGVFDYGFTGIFFIECLVKVRLRILKIRVRCCSCLKF
jgi:hypothetical protein